jgi:hypothetical protein
MLDEAAEELPEEFYARLNGGICFLPDAVYDDDSKKGRPVYILGEYISDPALGCYINIYYGSFKKVFAGAPPDEWRKELKATLVHEFTHHVEHLAWERGLEIKDAIEREMYNQ